MRKRAPAIISNFVPNLLYPKPIAGTVYSTSTNNLSPETKS